MNEQTQLIQEIQSGLLGWYPFEEGKTIAYIHELDVEKEQISYDYLISVADFEKTEEPEVFLQQCKKLLKPDGHLFLAVNNRMGIKYFCGDKDPYSGRNFDGIEGYRRVTSNANDTFIGKCYNKYELEQLLQAAGFEKYQFFSLLTDLNNPSFLFAQDYLPNEDLTNRVFPTYNDPSTVFLEEAPLYKSLIENGMFHTMANAYLIEVTLGADLCPVKQVTASMDRGHENALFTLLYPDKVIKKSPYPEGQEKIESLAKNESLLATHGIKTVSGKIVNAAYEMPFIHGKVGQLYLKELFYQDKELFIQTMDHFKDLILSSSEILEDEKLGPILQHGFVDMVPLNSFYIDGEFVFFDQEFVEENYPAKAIIFRMISTFYASDAMAQKLLPREMLLERYGLSAQLETWQKYNSKFLVELRKEKELSRYHSKTRANYNIVNSNRQRMNYSTEEYDRLFVNIFDRADTRTLILFGSGLFAEKFLTIFGSDYPVHAIVDNNPSKWGQELLGVPICSPDILNQFDSGQYKVIICIKNYLSVMHQLQEMGKTEFSIYDAGKSYPKKLKPIVTAATGEKSVSTTPKKYHIGYVAGVFDMFHVGHLNLLKKAKEQCEYLIVGVLCDEHVQRLKERNPIIPGTDRVEIVRSCRYVDQAELLHEKYASIREAYNLFHFDCLFSGDDHTDSEDWQNAKAYLRTQGADIVFFDYTKKVSSTMLREKI